jgi:undecaprenyl-diphosphatase
MRTPPLRNAPIVSLLLVEIIVGAVLACLSFLLFFDLSRHVMAENFLLFDRTITTYFYSVRSPELTQFMLLCTFLGSPLLLSVASVTLFCGLLWKKYRYEAALFALTFVTGFWLSLLFKAIVARARPETAPLIRELFYSFPSGHSMNSLVFYALLSYLVYHFTRRTRGTLLVSFLCGLLILLIGSSRIYLGVHYPSDVVAGYLAGSGWFLTVLVIARTLTAYRSRLRK